MRTTLAPSMLNVLALNINRGNPAGRLFECAPVFCKTEERLPDEKRSLCLGMYGDGVDFYALKDEVYCLLQRFGVQPTIASGGDIYYHPGRKAVLSVDGQKLAQLGEIHPDTAARFEIAGKRVYLAEIDLTVLERARRPVPAVTPLPRFPAVSRDLALVMDESVGVGPVMETIRHAAGKTLEEVRFFDIYRGAQLGAAKKSAAFSLTFRAADRTLTEADIAKEINKVLAACERDHGAHLRA